MKVVLCLDSDSESSISTLDTARPTLHELLNPRPAQERHSLSVHSGASQHTDRPAVKYHFKLLPFFTVPVAFDRLDLVTVLDRLTVLPHDSHCLSVAF